MGPIARVICFILALLTVLSITPAFLLVCACTFSPSCLEREFARFMVGPGGLRPVAIVIMLGPALVLLTYVFTFLRCYRRRDTSDLGDRRFG
jgi:hypothetical protein